VGALPVVPGCLGDSEAPCHLADRFALIEHPVSLCDFGENLIGGVPLTIHVIFLPCPFWSVFSHLGRIGFWESSPGPAFMAPYPIGLNREPSPLAKGRNLEGYHL
jgi:hypothetical protein